MHLMNAYGRFALCLLIHRSPFLSAGQITSDKLNILTHYLFLDLYIMSHLHYWVWNRNLFRIPHTLSSISLFPIAILPPARSPDEIRTHHTCTEVGIKIPGQALH